MAGEGQGKSLSFSVRRRVPASAPGWWMLRVWS